MQNVTSTVESANDATNSDTVIDIINNSSYNNRAVSNTYDRTDNTPKDKGDNDKNNNNTNEINVNIFRFKFTTEFTCELHNFSKIHQYDHRKDFKEAWLKWVEENNEIIDYESRRHDMLGYDGDILDKMYKSARYYFRKKSTEKKEPQKRRSYKGTQKELLEAMDNHIRSNINNDNYKPSDGFDDFCKTNIELLKEEVNQLCKNGLSDSEEIKNKIKKTYKNRYFLLISK
jgi:hypothetical protein